MQRLELLSVEKTFTMHLQGGLRLPVLRDLAFGLEAGQCVALTGPSGAGKSSVLKLIYGNYRCDRGEILVHGDDGVIDIARATPRQIIKARRQLLAYVTQFLRALPRVSALDVVADALADIPREAARDRAATMLARLNVPERLWRLPPATFSGGEQQRVNLARGFLPDMPILLLDEPTASLDAANSAVVIDLIQERKSRGTAIVAIVHDEAVRDAIADVCVDITRFSVAA